MLPWKPPEKSRAVTDECPPGVCLLGIQEEDRPSPCPHTSQQSGLRFSWTERRRVPSTPAPTQEPHVSQGQTWSERDSYLSFPRQLRLHSQAAGQKAGRGPQKPPVKPSAWKRRWAPTAVPPGTADLALPGPRHSRSLPRALRRKKPVSESESLHLETEVLISPGSTPKRL